MITNQFSNLTDLSIITNAINSTKTVLAINKYNITEEELTGLTDSVEINREILSEKKILPTKIWKSLCLQFFRLLFYHFYANYFSSSNDWCRSK